MIRNAQRSAPCDAALPTASRFEWPVRVYWEDTDAGGIVFYANYLKFMERSRTEWLRALGIHQHALREQTGGMFVVSETELKYHRPARLDDSLLVTTALASLGSASIVVAQQVLLVPTEPEQPKTLLCEGRIRIGWVDAQRMRPARFPEALAGTLGASLHSINAMPVPASAAP